jgi:hypothetical protein
MELFTQSVLTVFTSQETLFQDLLLTRSDFVLQCLVLFSQLSHVEFLDRRLQAVDSIDTALALLRLQSFSILFFLDRLHSKFLHYTSFISLSAQLNREVLPGLVFLRFISLLLLKGKFLDFRSLGLHASLLDYSGPTGELVPHPTSALHEVFILHLL